MKVAVFDFKKYEEEYFSRVEHSHELHFFETRLNSKTVKLVEGFEVVCVFVNDHLDSTVIEELSKRGIKHIALRCAGFNNVDLDAAKKFDIKVSRVAEYSPYAVAEFAATLILALNRKIHKSYNRTKEQNFTLDGLVGFDMHNKTIGIIGTGKIGSVLVKIMNGFGCKLLAVDENKKQELVDKYGLEYCSLEHLLSNSDIVSLHLPLTKTTHHLLNENTIGKMKPNSLLINTSRGGLIDAKALIQALKTRSIAGAGLDVYEEEEDYFYKDFSNIIMCDDDLVRLLSFPNVLISSHQAYLTEEALMNICRTTLTNF